MSRTNQWYLAVDNAIVAAHIGTAETYATPELAVNALCCWFQDVGAHFAKERIKELEETLSTISPAGTMYDTDTLAEIAKDTFLFGTGFIKEGKQINPKDVYIASDSETMLFNVDHTLTAFESLVQGQNKVVIEQVQQICEKARIEITEKDKRIEELETEADNYKRALIHIRDHMEIIMAGEPELSAIWNIADNSLPEESK